MMSQNSPWWVKFSQSSQEKCKLFCFPFAGGDIYTYRLWGKYLDPQIALYAVQLPGRGARFQEPGFTRLEPLIEELAKLFFPELKSPFAFFGHSLGGLIAFELTRYLKRNFSIIPQRVFISSSLPVHLYRNWHHNYHQLSDVDLLKKIESFGGISKQVLEHPDLIEMLLPTVRSDMEILETYQYQNTEKLSCPLHVFSGKDDTLISVAELKEWKQHSSGEFSLKIFPGGHFYLNHKTADFFSSLNSKLTQNC